MFQAYFNNNVANEVWGLPVAAPAGATAATGDIVVTAAPTVSGTIHLYIAGTPVPVQVSHTDTVSDIATAIADAVNTQTPNAPALPVTATAATGTVTITAAFGGINGNDITVLTNYYGSAGAEYTPAGLVMTLPTNNVLAGGTGVPDFSNAIANIQKKDFEYVALPYTDPNAVQDWMYEYEFMEGGRWSWSRQQFGHVFIAARGLYSDLITLGGQWNSGVLSFMGFEKSTPSSMMECCAAYAAKAQRALINDPARPLQTLQFQRILPALLQDRFDFQELNGLAWAGIAIQEVAANGIPMILRETTTYQKNSYGSPDDAYELVTTLATLARLLRNQKQAITTVFARCKLADDGTRFGPGQAIATPSMIKAELINEYQYDQWNGLVENTQAFADNLIVERDDMDPNRVNVLYPPDLINQLRIFAVLAQFRLQYDRGDNANIGLAPGPFSAAAGGNA
jgi:phage tail sheath gpL-like